MEDELQPLGRSHSLLSRRDSFPFVGAFRLERPCRGRYSGGWTVSTAGCVRTTESEHCPPVTSLTAQRDQPKRPRYRRHQEILLVDDEVSFVETLGALLRMAGYEVIAEYSQRAARRYLSTHTPDVLITDLRLGDGEGWSLVEFVRRHQPFLPIAIVTGFPDVVPNVESYGHIPVFTKPFDPDDLLTYLESVL